MGKGMFEDVDDILAGKRKRPSADDEEPSKRPPFNSNRGYDGLSDAPTPDEIKEALQKRFGGDVEVIGMGSGTMIGMPTGNPKKERMRSEGLMETLVYLAEQMKLAPTCKDVAGKELAIGDELKVPGGEKKTVLKLGWKFVRLSRTDDQTKDDGVWFENEISNGNFIKI